MSSDSTTTANLCFDNSGGQKKLLGNQKRKRFLKRQQFLMKNGYLRKKQCLQNQGPPPRNNGGLPSEHRPLHNQGPPPRNNGATSEHKPLPSAAHNKSSCHSRQVAESASTSSSKSSLTITLKTPGQSGRSVPFGKPLKYLAIDCEMVGTGPKGSISELARCSIVSYDGDVVYDKYVKPANPVTDLRTRWSGITWSNLSKATPFVEARKEILKLLAGKVVIGHAIHNDFKALSYGHPAQMTRDTARIPLLNHKAGFAEKECASLKRLTKALFNRDIQTGRKGHSSVEDARATMELYKVVEVEWERTLASRSHNTEPEQS